MIKKFFKKVAKNKLQKHNDAQYRRLVGGAITPAEEVEIRAIYTRAQR